MKNSWLIASLLMTVSVFGQEQATPEMDNATTTNTTTEIATQEVSTNVTTTNVTISTNEMTGEITTNMVEGQATSDTNATAELLVEENKKLGYTVQDGDRIIASPLARFEVKGIDEQSGLKEIGVSVDGAAYTPYKNPISFSDEGNHTLSYQFTDNVGNVSTSKNFDIFIDATGPRVVDMSVEPAVYRAAGVDFVGANSQIGFRAHDDLAGVSHIEYSVNDQPMTKYTTNITFSGLGITNTEPVKFSYQALDMVSNVSVVKTRYFVIDATAPVVDVFAKAIEIDGVRYISPKDKITIETFDSDTKVAKVMYAINTNEYQSYHKDIGIFLKESGEYTVHVRAYDVVGNEAHVEYKVTVDTVAPTGETLYIGDEKSSEYDPLEQEKRENTEEAQSHEAHETTTEEAMTTDENMTAADPSVDDMVTSDATTSAELEVPAGSQVDAMQ